MAGGRDGKHNFNIIDIYDIITFSSEDNFDWWRS